MVLAAVLLGAYLLVVKPAIDKGEHTVSSVDQRLEQALGVHDLGSLGKTVEGLGHGAEQKLLGALHTAKREGRPKRLVHCVQHAGGEARKIRRCVARF